MSSVFFPLFFSFFFYFLYHSAAHSTTRYWSQTFRHCAVVESNLQKNREKFRFTCSQPDPTTQRASAAVMSVTQSQPITQNARNKDKENHDVAQSQSGSSTEKTEGRLYRETASHVHALLLRRLGLCWFQYSIPSVQPISAVSSVSDASFCGIMSQHSCSRYYSFTMQADVGLERLHKTWLETDTLKSGNLNMSLANVIASQNISTYHVPVCRCRPWCTEGHRQFAHFRSLEILLRVTRQSMSVSDLCTKSMQKSFHYIYIYLV